MIEWLQYFFGSFFSNRQARQCQWRSLGNTALSGLLCFALLVCGLTWGYQASFSGTYRNAEEFRAFVYQTLEETDVTIQDGIASGNALINTYSDPTQGYQLVVDLRDTEQLFDDFILMCRSKSGAEISYEAYLAQPAHVQQEYTDFVVQYTGKTLDLAAGRPAYQAYLQQVSDESSLLYQQEIAQQLNQLQTEQPEDYDRQLYLLYVQAYYPQLSLQEYGAKAPTLRGYYYQCIAQDTQGKLLVLLREQCYVGFQSGGKSLFFAGNYSRIKDLEPGQAGADRLITQAFRSGSQADYMMYLVNVFGLFFPVILLWLMLMFVVRLVCRKRHIEAGDTFGSAAQLVGSFLMGSGLVAGAVSFLLSFLVSQNLAYYAAAALTVLTLILRTVHYLWQKIEL